jgi:hypothetical protein
VTRGRHSDSSGWWVPAEDSVALAVPGGPNMSAHEYRVAFRDKLAALVDKEGREIAVRHILYVLDPHNQQSFNTEMSSEDIAEQLLDVLPWPTAHPEQTRPASPERARQAVEAQEDLELSFVLSAAMR